MDNDSAHAGIASSPRIECGVPRNDKQILIATKNPGKFREIQTILGDLPLELVFLGDLAKNFDFEENGTTFEENAIAKARFFAKKHGMPTLGEDSGILVDALQGEMGVKTRRWGKGESASDKEWLEHFLERMRAFPDKRDAEFVCAAALSLGENTFMFTGSCKGEITIEIEAPILQGLPLSSVFRPKGFARVYAALTPEEKGKISHRGVALMKAKAFLRSSGYF